MGHPRLTKAALTSDPNPRRPILASCSGHARAQNQKDEGFCVLPYGVSQLAHTITWDQKTEGKLTVPCPQRSLFGTPLAEAEKDDEGVGGGT